MSNLSTIVPSLLTLAEAKGKTFSHLPPDKAGGLYSLAVRTSVVRASLAGVETIADLASLPKAGSEDACRLLCGILKAGGCLRDPAGFMKACAGKGWSDDHTSIPSLASQIARETKAREKAQAKEGKTVKAAQAVADAAGIPEAGPAGKGKGKNKDKGKGRTMVRRNRNGKRIPNASAVVEGAIPAPEKPADAPQA